jgi:hypothetical protein
MSHPFTRIVFRVGDDDAKKLAEGFSYFEAKDLRNLETGQAICRVERSDFDFNLSVPLPVEPDKDAAAVRRQKVITVSREKYGTARADVEAIQAKSRATPVLGEPAAPAIAKAPQDVVKEKVSIPEVPTPPPLSEILKAAPAPADETQEPPRDLGRGNAQHKAIQERLQAEAYKLGFRAEIEKQLSKGSNQAADLILKRDDLAIAVEITVTTSTSHEFENVQKCLAAGYARVAVISTSRKRLEEIAAAVQGGLGSTAAAKISFHTPDEFIAELQKLAAAQQPQPPFPPGERKSHGRTVRRHLPELSSEELKQREDLVNKMLVDTMRSQRRAAEFGNIISFPVNIRGL